MLDVLNDYLEGAATPELKLALENAHEVLENSGIEDYERVFEELLMLDDTTDAGETLTAIVHLTKGCLIQILAQHGVVFRTEAELDFLTNMVAGLLSLPDYENKDEIYRTATMDGSSEEVFAELMAFVTPESVDQVLCMLVSVERMLLARVQALMTGDDDAMKLADEVDAKQRFINKLIAFCHYIGTDELHIVRMLALGVHVGYPLAVYLEAMGREELEGLEDEHMARELLAMAYISSDGIDSARAAINEHLEHFIADPDRLTKIDILVSDLALGFER